MNNEHMYEDLKESIYFWVKVKFGVILAIVAGGYYLGVKYLPDDISTYFVSILIVVGMILVGISYQQFNMEMYKIKVDEELEKKNKVLNNEKN